MIVVRLRSGLGNQMFQYAFFLQLQQWYGKENVKLDVDTYHWRAHNGRELDKIFSIDLANDSIPPSLSLQMADVGYSLKHRLLRRLRGKKHRCYRGWKDMVFDDYKKLPGELYLEGCWPEERYFSEVAGRIRKIYTFPAFTDQANLNMLQQIESTCSVGVHVRRGDYIHSKSAFPMCPAEYYLEASEIIRNTCCPEPHFFIFSDDIKWSKANLRLGGKMTFVDINPGENAYKDMALMAQCKHQIIANSTFSWWAAWLNTNPGKTVIYPSTILIRYETMPGSWIKVNVPTRV